MADRHQVYMTEDTTAWLLARAEMMMQPASAPKQARTELGLWRAHLDAELVCVTWTLGEIGCIADVLNRPVVEAAVGSLLWAYLADAFDGMDGAYAAKWGIDEAALIERARKLGPAACHALTAAVWAWWTAGEDHSRDGWARVGVRVIESDAALEHRTLRKSQERGIMHGVPRETVEVRVRGLIEQSGQTQEAFGASIGLDSTKLSKALNGKRRFSSLELARIAEACDVTVDWLLSGDGGAVAARVSVEGSPVQQAIREAARLGECRDNVS